MFLNAEQTHLPLTLLSVLKLPVKVGRKNCNIGFTVICNIFYVLKLARWNLDLFYIKNKEKNRVQVVFLCHTMGRC